MNEANTLGLRIQAGRKEAGLSQEALGEQLGVSRQAVSKWEADAAIPELENLIAMSRMFGVSIGQLLGIEQAEAAPGLSEQELQAAQAIAEKYAEQIKPQTRPRWMGLTAALLACAVIIGIVQWRANHRIADLNEQLVTLQMQMNDIQNGVAGQISSFTSKMHSALEEQTSSVFNTSAKITGFSIENRTVTISVTATAKEWDDSTTGQFTATLDDGSVYTADAVCNNGVFTADGWELPRDSDGGFDAQFSITLWDSGIARTSPVDSIYAYPEDFRLNISGTTNVSVKDNVATLYRVQVDYYEGGYAYILDNSITAVDFCVFRNDATQPETVIPLTDFVETLKNNKSISSCHTTCLLRENGLTVELEEGDTVLFVLRAKDSFGNEFYTVINGLHYNGLGSVKMRPWSTDVDLEQWKPGNTSSLSFN